MTHHKFDEEHINQALEAVKAHYADRPAAEFSTPQETELAISGGCISLKVENGQVCVELPLGFGKVCLPIPIRFPDGTVAEACLHICTTWGIPTGVKVTVSIGGVTIVTKTFGKC